MASLFSSGRDTELPADLAEKAVPLPQLLHPPLLLSVVRVLSTIHNKQYYTYQMPVYLRQSVNLHTHD
jgi:hypothetical protein